MPARLTLTIALTPPITTFGLTPRLLAAGVERPIYIGGRWSVGWLTHGQIGTVTGAFTCPRSVLGFPEGSADNAYGCDSESADVVTLRYAGAALTATRSVGALGRTALYVTGGGNYVDSRFQVNAHTFGYLDRTRIQASGMTVSSAVGMTYRIRGPVVLSADMFYSPLSVQPTPGAAVSTRGLLTARGSLTYRLR
jgi:hypothetical protein